MTKQEKIKEAWGDYWVYINSKSESKNQAIENDGWVFITNLPASFNRSLFDFQHNELICRPKSLKGIETNNGWIKIESDNLILPMDGTEVHFYHSFINENGLQNEYHIGVFNAAIGFTSYYDSEHYKIKEVTHYQPITKPEPPIY